jgi:hypothetical protein
MRRLCSVGRTRIILTAFAVTMGGSAAMAQSLITEAKARQEIEARYSVQVLRIQKAEEGKTPVFIIKVMNKAGNFNEAFQVNVVMMDRRTGKLIPQFQHTVSGTTGMGNGPRDIEENIGPSLRELSTGQRSAE